MTTSPATTAETERDDRLGRRDFRILWSSQAVFEVGAQMAQLAYPLLVLAITNSPLLAGILGFAGVGGAVLVGLPAGALVDRLNRRTVMLAVQMARMCVLAILGVWLTFGTPHVAVVLIVATVDTTVGAFFVPAERAALRRVVRPERLVGAYAQNQARGQLARLIGPSIGGILYGFGRQWPFLASAFTCLVSAFGIQRLRVSQAVETEDSPPRLWSAVRDGLAHVWRSPFMRAVIFCGSVLNIAAKGLLLTVVVLLRDDNAPASAVGVVFTIASTAGLLGALAVPLIQRVAPPPMLIMGVFWATAAITPLIAVVHGPIPIGALLAIAFFFSPVANVTLFAHLALATPDEYQGRVQSVTMVVMGLGSALGPLLVGLLLENSTGTVTVIVLAGIFLTVALTATVSRPIRHLRRPEALATVGGGK